MLSSKNGNSYVTLDYDALNESGLKSLTKEIGTAGVNIVKILPGDRPKKSGGIYVKTFTLVADDGQEMEIQVNDTGDISGAKLNKKATPLDSAKSLKELASKISSAFTKAAPAFKRSLAKKLNKAKDLVKERKPSGLKSLGTQLSEAKEAVSTATSQIADANAEIERQKKLLVTANDVSKNQNDQLQAEKAREVALRGELKKIDRENANV